MSHQFETGMFGNGQKAWHGLGNLIPTKVYSIKEALEKSEITWGVEKLPLFVSLNGENKLVPDKYAIVRDSDKTILGVVGNQYEIFQPSNAFAFFDPFVGEGMTHVTSAISLNSGKRIVISVEVDDNARELINGDVIKNYIFLATSFDGSLATTIKSVDTRVVCNNTLKIALMEASNFNCSVKHTAKQTTAIDNASAVLKEYICHIDSIVTDYNTMAKRELKIDEFRSYLERVFENDIPKNTKTIDDYKPAAQCMTNYLHTPDLQLPGIERTQWAAFNAITQFTSHQILSSDANQKKQDSAKNALLFGKTGKLLKRAYDLALV